MLRDLCLSEPNDQAKYMQNVTMKLVNDKKRTNFTREVDARGETTTFPQTEWRRVVGETRPPLSKMCTTKTPVLYKDSLVSPC